MDYSGEEHSQKSEMRFGSEQYHCVMCRPQK